MLLTITCTRAEGADWAATDLGFLLHKNPARAQVFEQSYGSAHVLYPEATEQRCTAALLLEIDPVRLVRGKNRDTAEFSLGQYVNDRPYAASSLLSVAISTVFSSALHGRCDQRPELAAGALPLRIELPAVPCRGGPDTVERMFAPLGWRVRATPIALDPAFPEWGESHYVRLELTGTIRLAEALSHLYVLLPVLDGSKHYWLAADEIDKLLRAGSGWLPTHPERTWITRRYLARKHSLVRTALARLAEIDDTAPESIDAVDEADVAEYASDTAACEDGAGVADDRCGTTLLEACTVRSGRHAGPDTAIEPASGRAHAAAPSTGTTESVCDLAEAEPPTTSGTSQDASNSGTRAGEADSAREVRPTLAVARRAAVVRALHDVGARRVLDLGCGEGALLRELLSDKMFTEIVGVDVSMRALRIAQRRLRLDRAPRRVAERITLRQGALTYSDAALRGFDAAVLMEVVEHVDPPRLGALEQAVFGSAAPGSVIVTTPNGEYNTLFDTLPAGSFRHPDHRFEWSRAEFEAWALRVAGTHGYDVRFEPVGPQDPAYGSPTQLAVFDKRARAAGKGAA
ncbi:3' terminal RNA ribose 2'-O-methyltransferase Hen1 [Nocardia vaccinii]|uniref:3' terminal RNA ribose 2'-O-methyltransferase Hen1 n=1 Tax=Nocardia vaccinii TaxID=1822 RepID=UPI00082E5B2E|nr:3' terminal RNA ribose 2'-O-methyltransferase Hen1 [Nocardia vaccinii]